MPDVVYSKPPACWLALMLEGSVAFVLGYEKAGFGQAAGAAGYKRRE